jgi:hypothetical protein
MFNPNSQNEKLILYGLSLGKKIKEGKSVKLPTEWGELEKYRERALRASKQELFEMGFSEHKIVKDGRFYTVMANELGDKMIFDSNGKRI